MAYTLDKNLEDGMKLLKEGEDVDKAIRLINLSARKGTTPGKSYFEIGRIIREGVPGISPDPEGARKYYDSAVNQFLRSSCDSMDYRELGDYFYYGLGTEPVDLMKARDYYRLAAKNGDEDALKKAEEVEELLRSKKGQSEEETLPGANQGQAQDGGVVVAPVVEAPNGKVEPAQKEVMAAVQRDALLLKAVRMIDSPSSTMQERIDGIDLVKVASDDGSMRAAVLLGYLYEGRNAIVERDLDKARECYEIAISRGSVSAEFRLGKLYLLKEASYYNEDKGHEMIVDSAKKGYAYALNYLGDCFREKVLDSKNLDLAYHYYAIAGSKGLGLSYHNMADIDASRQQLDLAKQHEQYALENGYDPKLGIQDPLYYSLHL